MFLQFITAACRKRCCRYEALLTYFWSRPSHFHGIEFSQVSCSRFPVNVMFLQFITAACRTRCCRYEALLTQFWSRSSYFYGIGFSQVSCSRLPVNGHNFAIHYRSVSNTVLSIRSFTYTSLVSVVVFLWYRVLSGIM